MPAGRVLAAMSAVGGASTVLVAPEPCTPEARLALVAARFALVVTALDIAPRTSTCPAVNDRAPASAVTEPTSTTFTVASTRARCGDTPRSWIWVYVVTGRSVPWSGRSTVTLTPISLVGGTSLSATWLSYPTGGTT